MITKWRKSLKVNIYSKKLNMKRKLFLLMLFFIPLPLQSNHLTNNELVITSVSSKKAILLANHLKQNGVIKYSAYWCPNCHKQAELFGKKAYKKLTVIECARDGINSKTKLCIKKGIKGFPSWEINGEIFIGVKTLEQLSELTNFEM